MYLIKKNIIRKNIKRKSSWNKINFRKMWNIYSLIRVFNKVMICNKINFYETVKNVKNKNIWGCKKNFEKSWNNFLKKCDVS